MPIDKILLDMDGVIADFFTASVLAHKDAASRELKIECAKDMEDHFPYGEWDIPSALGLTVAEFWSRIDNYDFWINVPVHSGARAFVIELNEIAPVTMCTSASLSPECLRGKADWMARHIGSQYPMHLCYRGASKAHFARPDQLLIDDYGHNIEGYEAAGGPTIHVPRPWSVQSPMRERAKVSFLEVDFDAIIDEVMTKVEGSK